METHWTGDLFANRYRRCSITARGDVEAQRHLAPDLVLQTHLWLAIRTLFIHILDFTRFNRHLLESKLKWRERHEEIKVSN